MSKFILYEDPLILIRLSENPLVPGHIEVLPKKEVSFLTDLSNEEIEHLFYGASYAASVLFETLGAHGTNIILNEDEKKVLCVNVIARKEGDGLNFLWKPNQADPSELKEVSGKIKDVVDYELWVEEHPEEAKKQNQKTSKNVEVVAVDGEKENYFLKSLRRVP